MDKFYADQLEELKAIRKVLELIDGYIESGDTDILLRLGELRDMIKTALESSVLYGFGDTYGKTID